MTRRKLIGAGALASVPASAAVQSQDESLISLLVTGDINWTLRFRSAGIAYPKEDAKADGERWPLPHLITDASYEAVGRAMGRQLSAPGGHYSRAIQYGLQFASPEEEVRYPFRRIAPVLRQQDLVFSNLENPLSDTGRRVGAFRAPTLFAEGLRWAGVGVVSIANNHSLDAEGQGLMDTIDSLRRAGVGFAGGGRNLEDARHPCVVERKGRKFGFLAYTQYVNMGDTSFVTPEEAGVMPMDPLLMEEDIRRLRGEVDWLAVSVHWGKETRDVQPANRAFAHRIADLGADLVLGHHSPLSKGIEIYKGKLIIYSPGHLLFGHNHEDWGDSYLVRVLLGRKSIRNVEVLPIAGQGRDMSQPYLLEGQRAQAVLEEMRKRSAELDTHVAVLGDRGLVSI